MKNGVSYLIAFLVAALGISVAGIAYAIHVQYSQLGDIEAGNTQVGTTLPTAKPTATPAATPSSSPLPASTLITVPYTLQAPFNVWDALHEDACEETSLIMVKHFLDGTPISSPTQADTEITALVHWEEAHGYGLSITLDQLNQIAKDDYGMNNGKVLSIDSIDQVKQELAAGHPVILGMAGKLLPNPYFSAGGPNYHMLVATGYDATGIITNEPGTWRGLHYHYDYQPFYNAIHDWDPDNIQDGQKAYLVFK
ncbi:MAG: C39 family peptidase [bacterium]